jgi:hypothetical protein
MTHVIDGATLRRPLCNRVTPFGKIVAASSRGAFMGNRGALLGPDGTLGSRRWTTKCWVCCRLEFRGRRVPVWQPGQYTPLFFADEAVALAAGHRPCGECRHHDLTRFKQAWQIAHGRSPDTFISTREIDQELHAARVGRNGNQITLTARVADVPDHVFVTREEAPEQPYSVREGNLYPWSFDGYREPLSISGEEIVRVLTPRPIAEAIRAGYVPTAGAH